MVAPKVKRPAESLITHQYNIGVTEHVAKVTDLAAGLLGMTPGTYIRQALVEKLVAQKFIPHPMAEKVAAFQANAAPAKAPNGIS